MTKSTAEVLAIIKAHPEGITSVAISKKLGLLLGVRGGASLRVRSAVTMLGAKGLISRKKVQSPVDHIFQGSLLFAK